MNELAGAERLSGRNLPISLVGPWDIDMPRRLKLSSLQRDITMMLEEAGAESVGTVIAPLKPSDLNEFAAQVEGLVTLGLLRK